MTQEIIDGFHTVWSKVSGSLPVTFVVLLGKLSMVVSPEIMAWTFKDAFGGLPRRRRNKEVEISFGYA